MPVDRDAVWIALSLVDHLGGKKLLALRDHFEGDLDRALRATAAELRSVRGIGPKIAAGIQAVDLAAVTSALPGWRQRGLRALPLPHPDFPRTLAATADPPATLFVVGEGAFPPRAAAIVGTRVPSDTAREAALAIAMTLVTLGYSIISGLALGVDTAAHQGALALPDGHTAAVLGGGVFRVYPPANRPLAQAITRRGLVISETHPEAEVSPSALVARNRIITGLADVVIIVETSVDGGAMHAARRAQDQGRLVFTVDPARLTGSTDGNQALVDAGIRPIAPDGSDLRYLLP